MRRLIGIEGPDFVGKTTVALRVAQLLARAGFDASYHKSPGGTPLGCKIRDLALDADNRADPLVLRILMQADFVQWLKTSLQTLGEDAVVVCDRWTPMSSLVYGEADGVDPVDIFEATRPGYGLANLDSLIILDQRDDELDRRAGLSHRSRETFKSKGDEYAARVRLGYRVLSGIVPDAMVLQAGDGEPHEIAAVIVDHLLNTILKGDDDAD